MRDKNEEKGEKINMPWFPNFVISEVVVTYILLGLLIVLASIFPAGLEERPDPLRTPPHIKPEWYFLFLYQFVKKVPPLVGVSAPFVGIFFLILLPFLDRNAERHPRKRIVAITLGAVAVTAILGLTVWGYLS
jgi:quinol-cytochrome oxidoreductase complex cytochrome b subunit